MRAGHNGRRMGTGHIDIRLHARRGPPAYTDPVSSRATGTYDGKHPRATVGRANPGAPARSPMWALYY